MWGVCYGFFVGGSVLEFVWWLMYSQFDTLLYFVGYFEVTL